MVAVTVLNVLVAAALPLWSTAIRREKEEELIFRGFQYAEAIRVFQMRYQRYPNKLEELIEVKPRSIRQLWKDPMTEDGKWALIFQNQPQPPVNRQPNGDPPPEDGNGGDDDGRPPLGPKEGDVVQVGPIIGVRSKSGEKSHLVFFGKERYDEWQFTDRMLLGGGARTTGIGPESTPPAGLTLSTRWLGRPMRFVDQAPVQPQDGSLPGQGPNKRGGRGRRNPP
jgi:type II secretory pathway pseudopilin PulG